MRAEGLDHPLWSEVPKAKTAPARVAGDRKKAFKVKVESGALELCVPREEEAECRA